jgi:Uma2 family endonuclease
MIKSNEFQACRRAGRMLTAADLAAMPGQLPSGPVNFELHEGRLVLCSPIDVHRGSLRTRIAAALVRQGEERGYGEAFSSTGIVIARDPDTVFGADAAFISKQSMPIRESKEGYLQTIPELVVEIRSKNDSAADLDRKIAAYLQAGVRLVWVVEPSTKTVSEYASGVEPKIFQAADALECEEIIPGFRLPLVDLFRE